MAQSLLINEDENDTSDLDIRSLSVPREKTSWGLLQMRYILIALLFWGNFNIYATRVTMSMALVCMVNHSAILQNTYPALIDGKNTTVINKCMQTEDVTDNETDINNISKEDGPFLWDEELQGIILSSFFWGYVFTQLPGGLLADKLGGKWIYALSIISSSVLTMTIPLAAQIHPILVILSRTLCGVTQGVFFPTTCSIASKWIPKQERSRFISITGSGVALGIVMTYPVSAALCKSRLFGGWPAIFYVIGGVGFLWLIFWLFLMFESPAQHPWISSEERNYIEQNCFCDSDRSQIKIPWKNILKSPPVLSLGILEFCAAFKFFMMLTQLPTYLKVVLNFNIEQNGYLNIIPSILSVGIGILSTCAADALINKGVFSVTKVRKAFTFAGFALSAICLLAAIQLGCNRIWIVILILIGNSVDSLCLAGTEANALDLSPNFTGVVKGILNTMAAAAGVAAPYTVGILIKNNNTKSSWDTAFYLATGLSIFGTLIYLIFGSGNTQSWNNHGQEDEDVKICNNEKVADYETTQLVKR